MQLTVTTRHIDDRQKNKILKDYVNKKVKRLERYINEEKDPSKVKVTLTSEKFRNIAEVLVNDGRMNVNASVEMEDMHAAIDGVMDIIIKQLRRKSEKRIKSKRRTGSKTIETIENSQPVETETEENDIIPEKLNSKPMSVEEAKLQLDVTDKGFVVFRNSESGEMNVLYDKKNSKAGLILP